MSTAHATTGIETVSTHKGAQVPPSLPRDDLPLFRFGLRQLFLFFTGLSSTLAVVASSHGPTAILLVLSMVVVAAHVFATALGSRLRMRADRAHVFENGTILPVGSIPSVSDRLAGVAAIHSRPRSPWHARGATTLPWLRRCTIGAITTGGVTGALYLANTIGYRTSPAGVVVGGLSIAVLCGWFTFLAGSFYGVFRHGFREASAEHQKDSCSAPGRL